MFCTDPQGYAPGHRGVGLVLPDGTTIDQPWVVLREATLAEWLEQSKNDNGPRVPRSQMRWMRTSKFYEISVD